MMKQLKSFERLNRDLGDYEFGLSSSTRAEDKYIVRTYSDRSLGSYYLYDKNSDELTKISDVSPWLDENEMAKMEPVKYTSRDGMTIHGYLTLPKGYNMENAKICRLLLILMAAPGLAIHGVLTRTPIPCQPWLCGPSSKFPRINRIWT
jgi:dipeptidyl aminopeptidase/acylaminoacyl peptidase